MQFNALVEEWPGESMVFFRELPGCCLSAATSQAALQAAPAAIEQYFRWLKTNDLTIVEGDIHPIEVVLAERLSSTANSTGPLFQADLVEPTEVEIDNTLNVAATARALIIEVIANVPAEYLEQALTPESWSLIQHLQHIMETENWYVSRLQEQHVETIPASSMTADDLSMKVFEDAMDNELILRNLTTTQLHQVFLHEGEQWTAAKVLRRQAGHLYEHLLSMMELERQLTAQAKSAKQPGR